MRRKIQYLLLAIFAVSNLQAQTVFGKWNTIDDKTGKPNSIVKIYEEDGLVYGEIIKVMDEADRKKNCVKCSGELKDQPIIGLVLLRGLEKSGDEFKGGMVTDPKTGKEYRCKMWLDKNDPNQLHVRGYVGFLYETKIWHRVK